MNFKEIKRLHKLGFAIHWLRPKSKVPLKSGWTKGPRETLSSLKESYKKGLNVGVRLGSVSKIGDKYLAVIDLDIKSTENRHRLIAEKKLFELFPEAKDAPLVFSGRGNGSAHYYCLTEKPLKGSNRKAGSSDVVKVVMPSADKPSKRERQELTPEELKKGVRLRPAWEISLMSEGRQVVLPGSYHPDTGALYTWARRIAENGSNLPVISTESLKSGESKFTDNKPSEKGFEAYTGGFEEVDPDSLGLRPEQLEALKTGEGVEDRSAYAFGLCMALLQRRISEKKIISLLTDRRFFLGEMAYDHAKTNNRKRAAIWVRDYCLKNAKAKVSESLFEHEIEEIEGRSPGWRDNLDRTSRDSGHRVKATFKNVLLILENEISPALLKRNVFSGEDFFGVNTPWGARAGQKRRSGQEDALDIKKWLIETYGFEATVTLIEEVLTHITSNNEFHPVKELLESLEWDGIPRVENAFRTYLGTRMPEPYLSDVTRKFFLSIIKRVYEPGCKFDHIVVLEGKQGVGKSTFGAILAGKEWFMDGLPDLADKDAALNLQGNLIVEMSELSSIYRSKLETTKAFITRSTDKVRPPYGKRRIDLPRQCVFLGSTNSKEYLMDDTGNRRYWPVEVNKVDFAGLERDRLQLLAEAKFMYDFCLEPLYLKGKAKKQAEEIQELRRSEDEGDFMLEKFKEFLEEDPKERNIEDVSEISLSELFEIGPFSTFKNDNVNRQKAARVLRFAGYVKTHTRKGNRWVAVKKG